MPSGNLAGQLGASSCRQRITTRESVMDAYMPSWRTLQITSNQNITAVIEVPRKMSVRVHYLQLVSSLNQKHHVAGASHHTTHSLGFNYTSRGADSHQMEERATEASSARGVWAGPGRGAAGGRCWTAPSGAPPSADLHGPPANPATPPCNVPESIPPRQITQHL